MHLIPNHDLEHEMCKVVGIASAGDLFRDIPAALRITGLELPPAEPERLLVSRLRRLLQKNKTYDSMPIFLGGGYKPQPVPASVQAVAHRQEFITSYTPYQPEVSQGLLQALFEYQSLMADITAMEVVNASMYDGVTALGEAALMAARVTGRGRFLVPAALSFEKQSTLKNYAWGPGIKIETFAYDDRTGSVDLADLSRRLGDDVAGVYLENPNHFGVFEAQAAAVGEAAKDAGALFVMGVDPTSLGIAKPPGLLGADIAIGEASCFGGAPALGGPLLGLFATQEAFVRKMPGRLIGATKDGSGKRGYVMTLQAREQHIRRSKATSNICTNEALLAIQAAIHLSLLGRRGVRDLGLQNLEAGARLQSALAAGGQRPRFTGAAYNEVVTAAEDVDVLHEALLSRGVHGGWRLGRDVPALGDCILWGSSPVHQAGDYHMLQAALVAAEEETAW